MLALPFDDDCPRPITTPQGSLLKWIGSKHRYADEIVRYFPERFGAYYEPFVGGGAVLATLVPSCGFASDAFKPLMDLWQTLHCSPETICQWYSERWHAMMRADKVTEYECIKASYNANPNAADLLFLCRACYGGVVRFRKADGYMSTPCGIHKPIDPTGFSRRVAEWHQRTLHTTFRLMEYEDAMSQAECGDLIYCDPPYSHSQAILYGAQSFSLAHLFQIIDRCKSRGVYVALSIDGSKKSGKVQCDIPIPRSLFEREILIDCGPSMLKRFQMGGQSLEQEIVAERLLLTY